LYTQASGQTQVPELRYVIVASGDEIVMAGSLQEALEELFPGSSPETQEDPGFVDAEPGEGEPDEPESDIEATVESLLDDANAALTDAQVALDEGDLGEYQRLVDEARQLIEEAVAIQAGEIAPEESPPESTTTTAPTDST
jgi:uncharacterized membrane protein (UPF0182 family)